jgi:hypothetical protein
VVRECEGPEAHIHEAAFHVEHAVGWAKHAKSTDLPLLGT